MRMLADGLEGSRAVDKKGGDRGGKEARAKGEGGALKSRRSSTSSPCGGLFCPCPRSVLVLSYWEGQEARVHFHVANALQTGAQRGRGRNRTPGRGPMLWSPDTTTTSSVCSGEGPPVRAGWWARGPDG